MPRKFESVPLLIAKESHPRRVAKKKNVRAPRVEASLPNIEPVSSSARVIAQVQSDRPDETVRIEVCRNCGHLPLGGANVLVGVFILMILTLSSLLMVATQMVSLQRMVISSFEIPSAP